MASTTSTISFNTNMFEPVRKTPQTQPRRKYSKSVEVPVIDEATVISETKRRYSTDKVRVLGFEDYKAAAYTLAEAFFDDDVAFYFLDVPDNGGKTREQLWPLHLETLEYIVYAHICNGLVLSIGENHEGVALWMPPEQNMDDWYTIARSGMWRLYYKLTPEGKKRYFGEFMEVLHNAKCEALGAEDKNAWYLVYIGVAPRARGRGYARKLIEHVTDKVDAKGGAPCYLESSHIRNVPMYERFGFEKHSRVTLGPDCEKPVPLDIMIRPAKSSRNLPELKEKATPVLRSEPPKKRGSVVSATRDRVRSVSSGVGCWDVSVRRM